MSVFSLMATLGIDTSKYDKGLDESEKKGSKFAKVLGKGFSGLGTVVKATGTVVKATGTAIVAASGAVAAFGTASVKTGMEFDSAVSQIAATMGTTVADIQDLRDKAEEMGRTTAFSATQAAEGLNVLAMSGYDAEQSMSMIESVLNLAAAGSLNLASAAGYVSGAMKGFNDETKDAEYYANLIAKGASLANTSVEQLGDALANSAAGAAAYSQSQETVTIALLKLAEQEEVGSAAGTALAAAMKNLYAPTNQAKKALNELGVKVYDSAGNARDFNDVTNELTKALSGYTEEQQAAYKQTIFGIQGLNAYNKIAVTNVHTQYKWEDALAASWGGAKKVTAKLKEMKGIDFSQIEKSFEDMGGDIQTLWEGLEYSNGNAADFLENVEKWSGEGDKAREVFNKFGISMSDLQEIMNNTAGAAKDMADTQLDNLKGDITLFKSALEGAEIAISDKLSPALRDFVQFGTASLEKLTTAFEEEGLSGAMSELGNIISDAIAMIIEQLPDFITAGKDLISAIIRGVKDNSPEIIKAGVEVLSMLVSDIPGIIFEISDALTSIVGGIIDELLTEENTENMAGAGVDIFVKLVEDVAQIIRKIGEALPGVIMGICDALLEGDNIERMINAGIDLFAALVDNVPKILLSLGEALWDIGEGIVEVIGEAIRKHGSRIIYDIVDFLTPQWLRDVLKDLGVADIDAYLEGLEESMNEQEEELIHNTNQRVKHVTGEAHDVVKREAVNTGKSYMDGISDGIEENEGELFEKIDVTVGEFIPVEKFVSYTGKNTGEAYTDALGAGATAPDKVSSLTLKLQGLADNVVGQFTKREADVESSGGRMADGLINGFTKKMPSIYTVIRQKVNGMVGVINQTLEIHSPSRVLARTGGFMGDGLGLGFIESIEKWSPIMANAIPTEFNPVRGTWGNANYDIVGTPAFRGGVNIVQNIYADAMSPAQVFEAAREEQEKAMFLGLGGIA